MLREGLGEEAFARAAETGDQDALMCYMLRRTVDDYLEIIEIKTAFSDPLFVLDRDRGVYYPSAELSPVIGQVMRYIEEVDRQRDSILLKDEADTLKIRARVIVGKDHSSAEQAAFPPAISMPICIGSRSLPSIN